MTDKDDKKIAIIGTLKEKSILKQKLAPGGGAAVSLKKATNEELKKLRKL